MPVDTQLCRCGHRLGRCDNFAVASVEKQWDALLPVKPTHDVKSRLLPTDRQTRMQLVPAFVSDMIAALAESGRVARIAIVGRRWQLAAEVATPIMWISEPPWSVADEPPQRLNLALSHAGRILRESARRPMIIVAADLPSLRAANVSVILGSALRAGRTGGAGEPGCACPVLPSFVRDASGVGTTMLLTPADVLPDPHFGPKSADRHASAGAVDLSALADVGTRRDVDTAADLRQALAIGLGRHSALAVAQSVYRGLAARDGSPGHDEAGQPWPD